MFFSEGGRKPLWIKKKLQNSELRIQLGTTELWGRNATHCATMLFLNQFVPESQNPRFVHQDFLFKIIPNVTEKILTWHKYISFTSDDV